MIEGAPGAPFDDEVVIRRRRWASADSAFAVIDAERDGDEIVLVGPIGHLEERERARIAGIWQDDRRFGLQVKVTLAEPLAPDGDTAVLAYLRRVKHVGLTRAARLLERYGDDVLDAIDRDPHAAFRSLGLNPKRTTEAIRSWQALRSSRALHLLLAPHGLAWLVTRLTKEYGDRAHEMVRRRPYELTSVFGVGFHIADTIAQATGRVDGVSRTRAGVLHVLAEAERDGSTCLPVPELAVKAAELLGGAPPTAALLSDMEDEGELVLELGGGTAAVTASRDSLTAQPVWAYRPATAALEAELADQVRSLAAAKSRLRPPRQLEGDLVPAPEQWAAVQAAFGARLSIVTGGPGTGKTATIRLICAAARAQRASIALVAPTGRAARRMAESTGLEATTIHSALGWVPGQGPTVDELDEDLLVVDETSMANLELLVTLLRAVGPGMHVVLVGDADQLAPVGAGKPFAELVVTRAVPVAELTHIFRQAAGSMIVRGAHAVKHGETPEFGGDLFLIEREDPRAALAEIVSLVSRRLPGHYGLDPLADIQVFAPVYKGALGIDLLNARLRDALNPSGRPVLGGRLRIGDKLMLSGRNLHDLGLMNGTVLRLVDHSDDGLLVSAEGVTVELPSEEAPRLQLAYACSIHKGQGIELPVAVVVAHPSAGAFFLRREMLYTAMTRARTATVIVGRRDVVARAARTPDTSRRHSRLGDRLQSS